MTMAALFLALAAAPAGGEPPAPSRGVEIAGASVTATILRPAIVRQGSGLERAAADTPKPQVTRRGREILVEFQ